jgi:hypothetical protein
MAKLYAIFDAVTGKKLSDGHLLFKASLMLEEYKKHNKTMLERAVLKECGTISPEDIDEKMKRDKLSFNLNFMEA